MFGDVAQLYVGLGKVALERGLPRIELAQMPLLGRAEGRGFAMDLLQHAHESRVIARAYVLGPLKERCSIRYRRTGLCCLDDHTDGQAHIRGP
jgi:hypothetical protein